MQLKPKEIEFIKKSFNRINDRFDFLELLNYAKELIYGKKVVPFEIKHLTYHSNPKANTSRYKTFQIRKKTGGYRTIHAPSKGLKIIQSCLALILQAIYKVNPAANGFVIGKSVLDNAKIHTGNIYVYNVDLKDFFSSIDQPRIWGRLKHPPFNLDGNKQKIVVANMIAAISCHRFEVERLDENNNWISVFLNVLPQGAPSSPVLTNIICQQLDFYFTAAARRFGVKYSRYADDITFSSMHNVFQPNSNFLNEMSRILKDQNFYLKDEKTRLQKDDYRQSVTGINVNVHPNLPKRYTNQIRQWLFFWESFGYDRANAYFRKKYKQEHIRKGKRTPQLSSVLSGKLDYLKMIKGSDDNVYIKFRQRLDKLTEEESNFTVAKVEMNADVGLKHSPIETVKFLKYFKYDNDFAFKQLVHRPLDKDNFDFTKILNRSNSQFSQLQFSQEGKLNLPRKLIENVGDFLSELNEYGVKFFKNTGEHPLDDRTTGAVIQKFKVNYRFGNERSESSILSELILNIAKKREIRDHVLDLVFSFGKTDTSGMFNVDQIKFFPDLQKFQSKANFFTWTPNVTIAISSIIDSILQHSNLNGFRNFTENQKEFVFDLKRKSVGDIIKIELVIFDKQSIFMGDLENMMKNMRRDYLSSLNSICDFKVQFATANSVSYQCQILPYSEDIEVISEPVNGFKYIFTFYD